MSPSLGVYPVSNIWSEPICTNSKVQFFFSLFPRNRMAQPPTPVCPTI